MNRLALAFFLISFSWSANAHAPIMDDDTYAKTRLDPYVIDDPEHSKAIYATLDGQAHYYQISSDTPFDFYVGITAPKLDSCVLKRSFSFDVLDENFKVIDRRSGAGFSWWAWYEEWGKKWYWVGPEIGQEFKSDRVYEAGTYYIRVKNTQNIGKYVLAVGDDERFGLKTILSLKKTVNEINEVYWDEADCDT